MAQIVQAIEERQVDIRSAFALFDTNSDGFVSPREFRHALLQMRLGITDEDIAGLLRRLDVNADGLVSYEEFLVQAFRCAKDPSFASVGPALVEHFASMGRFNAGGSKALWQAAGQVLRDRGLQFQQAFAFIDVDRNGWASRRQLEDGFRALQLGIEGANVERMVQDVGDGYMNLHEFISRLSAQ